jgi:arylsulfatase A-like enzyme
MRPAAKGKMKRPPNIVVIMADQWRADHLGVTPGSRCPTPSLDRLAARGCLFTRAVTPNPVCQPARAAFLTGRYPHQVNLTCQNGDLRSDVRTFLQALQDAGYHTVSCGKLHYWHTSRPTKDGLAGFLEEQKKYGFDEIAYYDYRELKGSTWCQGKDLLEAAGLLEQGLAHGRSVGVAGYDRQAPIATRWPGAVWPLPEELYLDNVVGAKAEQILRRMPTDAPFYLQVTFGGPHAPYDPPASHLAATPYLEEDDFIEPDGHPLSPADKKALGANRQRYRAMIACLDAWIGRMLDVLEVRGLTADTLVAFTSDHGEMLGDHGLYNKQMPYKESTRIPMIVAWPGRPTARRHDGMVELTDLTATLLDAAGIEQAGALNSSILSFHGRLPGRSLRGVVTGASEAPVRDFAFSVGDGVWIMVESSRWKLVRWTRDAVAAAPREELFDLVADPAELVNRAGDPACRTILMEHRERMLRVLESTPPAQMMALGADPPGPSP